MSIIRCEECEKNVDTDKEEAYEMYFDCGKCLDYWLCEDCFAEREYNQTNSDPKD